MVLKNLIALLLCLLAAFSHAAGPPSYRDSLSQKSFDYLFDNIELHAKNALLRETYLKAFIDKAKGEKNWDEIVYGYKNYIHYRDGEEKVAYADSMVSAALQSGQKRLIGSAYLSRGIAFYGLKRHNEALDNYLKADGFISATDDQYLKSKTTYNIAHLKYYLGFYEDAILLFEKCRIFFRDHNARAYLNTLHSLALCYNMLGDYGTCGSYISLGLKEADRLENHEMDSYFRHTSGVNNFFLRNYATAISEIKSSMPAIQENNDFGNIAVAHFYIGKSYWALRKESLGLPHLKDVDRIFREQGYMRPDLRENYELLMRYYKKNDNAKAALFYVDQLLKADSVIRSTQSYLFERMHKEYDTKELMEERRKIQEKLDRQDRNESYLIVTIFLTAAAAVIIVVRHRRQRRDWQRKFEQLMEQNDATQRRQSTKESRDQTDISREALDKLIPQLEKWERDKKFLDKDLSLARLAASFKTNTTYLSGAIAQERGKRFTEYINDLKIDYITAELKQSRKLREYNNGGLAEECGFTSTQRFVNAFKARNELSPTFFVEALKKKLEEEDAS
ncbi:helix-turn-helix domain-containing protein [Flavobacterium sp. WW92]|uniref:helix-turn-helix domain-containing protein n=1 Tax=unclassified Flavobacterium TaxID=196869 RepID=UPI0022247EF4|nr:MULTISPECIES: helix-turn-helix domain-containing protein [unclassified Flavobacterium]WDO12335.1 helix-turn-helix domain-containing protein [Flavobacterium sp. WW92]